MRCWQGTWVENTYPEREWKNIKNEKQSVKKGKISGWEIIKRTLLQASLGLFSITYQSSNALIKDLTLVGEYHNHRALVTWMEYACRSLYDNSRNVMDSKHDWEENAEWHHKKKNCNKLLMDQLDSYSTTFLKSNWDAQSLMNHLPAFYQVYEYEWSKHLLLNLTINAVGKYKDDMSAKYELLKTNRRITNWTWA